MWLVFKLQEDGTPFVYYFVTQLYPEEGELGLESGPRTIAVYQEFNTHSTFDEAVFDPNEDTLLVEIESDASKATRAAGQEDDGKEYDASGALESGLDLMNKKGEGLFNVTSIEYGDTLKVAVETYDGSLFETTRVDSAETALNDETQATEYKMKKRGVTGVEVPSKYKETTQVKVKWNTVTGASGSQVRLMSKTGKTLKTVETESLSKILKNLESDKKYLVKVRAQVGDLNTAWSDTVSFKTQAAKE